MLCALPFLFVANFASEHHFVMVYSDQWGLVPIIERALDGELRFIGGSRDGAILSARVRETRDVVLAAYPDVSRAMLRPVTPRPDRALAFVPRVHERRLSLFGER